MRETERYAVALDASNFEISALLVAAIEQSARKVTRDAATYLNGTANRV